jgi:large subunit ribosomal protein L15
MKPHELKPAPGARTRPTRVGRGIAAGRGKTAGRGTKGQKSRAGRGPAAWHEGGQTPIHIRVPKLRGFKRRFKVTYEVVNVGRISDYADDGRFADAEDAARTASRGRADAPLTVNAEILRQVGLIGNVRRPVKVLGNGDVRRKLFVVADAVTRSAREKIEAAGGSVQLLEIPGSETPSRGESRQRGEPARAVTGGSRDEADGRDARDDDAGEPREPAED